MTDTEIHRLETDKGFIYNCKRCLASETMPKTIVNDSRLPSFKMNNDAAVEIPDTWSDSRASILQIPRLNNISNGETSAMCILNEEADIACGVCDEKLNSDENVCDTCRHLCHSACMKDTEEGMCIACGAKDMQDGLSNEIEQKQHIPAHQASPRSAVEIQTKGKVIQRNEYTSKKPVVRHADPLKVSGDVGQNTEISTEAERTSSLVPDDHSTTQGSVPVVVSRAIDKDSVKLTAPKGNQSRQTTKKDSDGNRNRELRQQDLKLRKWEEELKLRESKCNDISKEFSHLEDYVRKTEARNVELEKTIRTLERKIHVLECGSSSGRQNDEFASRRDESGDRNSSGVCSDATRRTGACVTKVAHSCPGTGTDKLIVGVRDQVTQFIIKRLRSDLDQMERDMTTRRNLADHHVIDLGGISSIVLAATNGPSIPPFVGQMSQVPLRPPPAATNGLPISPYVNQMSQVPLHPPLAATNGPPIPPFVSQIYQVPLHPPPAATNGPPIPPFVSQINQVPMYPQGYDIAQKKDRQQAN